MGAPYFWTKWGRCRRHFRSSYLRVLQEMELERVGGTRTIKVDVRVLSASNRNIKEDVAKGVFREDLYYRLNVIHIDAPSLQERTDDIPLLVNHFIEKFQEGGDAKAETIELAPRCLESSLRTPVARKRERVGKCY